MSSKILAGRAQSWSGSEDSVGGIRCGDNDLGINQVLVESGVLAVLVRGRHQFMTLLLNPFPDPQLILGRPEELRNLFGVLVALQKHSQQFGHVRWRSQDGRRIRRAIESTHIVENQQNFPLSSYSCQSRAEGMGNAQRTCRREVAVSVRSRPRELRWASGVARAQRRVEAGREKREIERANTMLITE